MDVLHDIIIIGIQAWDDREENYGREIAMELSNFHRVLYINRAIVHGKMNRKLMNSPVKKSRISRTSKRGELVRLGEKLWSYHPSSVLFPCDRIKHPVVFDFFNKLNNKALASEIQAAAARLGFQNSVLINDNDPYRGMYMKDLLESTAYVYIKRSGVLPDSRPKRHAGALEAALMRKADLVITNSQSLCRNAEKISGNVRCIGEGFNKETFDNFSRHLYAQVIPEFPGPVIGYFGPVTTAHIDLGVIQAIAKNHSDKSIVLIGEEDVNFKNSNLHQLPNVFFTGEKPESLKPYYLRLFDVCIDPGSNKENTSANHAGLLSEYLYAGKPVVTMRIQTAESYAGLVYLAANPWQFAELINKAMKENSPLQS